MEEQAADERVDDFICAERAEPEKRFLASSGALYVVLLIAVFSVILIANAVSVRWNWPRAIVQLALYAILLALAWLVYRYRLLTFRYTLTKRMLSVDRVVGKKIRFDTGVRLRDVISIHPVQETVREGKWLALYPGRRSGALALCAIENGKKRTLIIKPSGEFAGRLMEQWKSQRK